MSPRVLSSGNSEPLKAAVHGVALVTAAVCGAYNIAAWLVRREKHLAVNGLFYSAAVMFEIVHVRHHLAAQSALAPVSVGARDEIDDAA